MQTDGELRMNKQCALDYLTWRNWEPTVFVRLYAASQ